MNLFALGLQPLAALLLSGRGLALGIEARRAGRAARQMRSALWSFDYAQDKLMPREPAPGPGRGTPVIVQIVEKISLTY